MVHVFAAKEDELPLVLELLREAALWIREKGQSQWGYWLNPPEDRLLWLRDGLQKGEFYFLKGAEGHVIGMFRMMRADELYWGVQDIPALYLHSLVIRPPYAGTGLGSEIFAYAEQTAKTRGIRLIRLDCHAGNAALCAYYEKKGFVRKGEKHMPHSLNNLYEKAIDTGNG